MRPYTDWDKFKLFYYVANAGSYTAAGKLLNLSQPAISRSIQILEHQLGIKLFERVARGVILTKQGETLLEAAAKAFEEFSRAEALMLEEGDEPQGALKIATTMAMATAWIMHHISDFMRLYPKLRLSVIGVDELLDLKTRQADVSIRPFMDGRPELVQERLFTFHLKLYASARYLEDYGTPQTAEDLDAHKMIVFGYDAANPYDDINWPLKLGMPRGLLREPYLCINTSSGMRQAAEESCGIVALSAEHPGLESSGLIEVLAQIEKPSVPIYYVYPEQLRESKRVKALGDYLKQRFEV